VIWIDLWWNLGFRAESGRFWVFRRNLEISVKSGDFSQIWQIWARSGRSGDPGRIWARNPSRDGFPGNPGIPGNLGFRPESGFWGRSGPQISDLGQIWVFGPDLGQIWGSGGVFRALKSPRGASRRPPGTRSGPDLARSGSDLGSGTRSGPDLVRDQDSGGRNLQPLPRFSGFSGVPRAF